jgi:phosphoribosylanthranilate isomerase
MKLKICGVKSVEEARQLRKVGVDLIGLNFIPTSKRCITIETAEAIIAEFQGSGIQTVALFADKPIDEVNNYSRRLQINFVQLHGNEPPDYAKQI